MDRRQMLATAMGAAFARFAQAMSDEGDQMIPFLDSRPFNPEKPTLKWDELTAWLTPKDQRFRVGHYGFPEVDHASWSLQIGGLVDKPMKLTLDDLKKRKTREQLTTLECSGNPANGGMVYNTKWKGTPLAPLLKEAGIKPEGVEVVFFAAAGQLDGVAPTCASVHIAEDGSPHWTRFELSEHKTGSARTKTTHCRSAAYGEIRHSHPRWAPSQDESRN